MFHRHV